MWIFSAKGHVGEACIGMMRNKGWASAGSCSAVWIGMGEAWRSGPGWYGAWKGMGKRCGWVRAWGVGARFVRLEG